MPTVLEDTGTPPGLSHQIAHNGSMARRADVLDAFHPAVAGWFRASFEAPTPPQAQGWPAIARGESTLILAPTGSGKTLAAFLWAIDRVMFPASAREPAAAGSGAG